MKDEESFSISEFLEPIQNNAESALVKDNESFIFAGDNIVTAHKLKKKINEHVKEDKSKAKAEYDTIRKREKKAEDLLDDIKDSMSKKMAEYEYGLKVEMAAKAGCHPHAVALALPKLSGIAKKVTVTPEVIDEDKIPSKYLKTVVDIYKIKALGDRLMDKAVVPGVEFKLETKYQPTGR